MLYVGVQIVVAFAIVGLSDQPVTDIHLALWRVYGTLLGIAALFLAFHLVGPDYAGRQLVARFADVARGLLRFLPEARGRGARRRSHERAGYAGGYRRRRARGSYRLPARGGRERALRHRAAAGVGIDADSAGDRRERHPRIARARPGLWRSGHRYWPVVITFSTFRCG